MIYWASTGGASEAEIQKRNLDFAVQELAKCAPHGESFVYVVPAEVMFDMRVNGRRFLESDPVAPTCLAGQICQVMEGRVLEYEHGYVIRIMPLIDSGIILTRLDWMRHGYYNGKQVVDTSFQFSSRYVIDDMANTLVRTERRHEFPRVYHHFSGVRLTTSYIAYMLLGEAHLEIEFNETGGKIFPDLPSSLHTEHVDGDGNGTAWNSSRLCQWTYEIGERTLERMRSPRWT